MNGVANLVAFVLVITLYACVVHVYRKCDTENDLQLCHYNVHHLK